MNPKRLTVILLVPLALVLTLLGARRCNAPQKVESGLYIQERIYTGARADIWTARFGPGDSLIAAASVDSSLYIWNSATGALVRALRQPCGLTSASWSPDGTMLVSSGYDGALYLWSWPAGVLLRRIAAHTGTAWAVRFSPDGRAIVSCGEDRTVQVRQVPGGALLHRLAKHTLNVWDAAFSPDGKWIASGSFDTKLLLWGAADGQLRASFAEHGEAVVSLAFSPDGRLLASTSDDNSVRIRDVAGGSTLHVLHTTEHQQGVAFSPDGRQLLTCGRDKNMLGELEQNFFGEETTNPGVSMRLWDLQTGAVLQTFSGHANDANDVQFSTDGSRILSAGADKKVILWKRK
ncbi:MAG: WD40 repeat domain-containing protein [Chitinophagaceae bacterium]|nr:MAG: WD40 repeat domain-containing protein [Chitinophagaceae bacterium]